MARFKLTDQQLALIDHYFECDFVKAEAMRRAGYSSATIEKSSKALFSKPQIVAEIDRKKAILSKKHQSKQDQLLDI